MPRRRMPRSRVPRSRVPRRGGAHMCRITVATLAVVSTLAFGTWPAWVQEIPKTLQGENTEQLMKDRINSWTVGIAAGNGSGTAFTFVEEMRRVLDDGDNMRVLPIITRGVPANLDDLLYLRGVDIASPSRTHSSTSGRTARSTISTSG